MFRYFLLLILLCSFTSVSYATKVVLKDKDFHPSSIYNSNLSLFSAYASERVYSDSTGEISDFLDSYGFSDISFHSIKLGVNDTQFIVANKKININGIDNNLILISFRGTTPTKVEDILTDLDSSKRLFTDGYSEVHSGFFSSMKNAKSMEKDIYLFDYINNSKCTLDDFISNKSKKKIFLITGHSLGGAISTLYAADLIHREEGVDKSNILVYTFGSPAVGDEKFVSRYDGNIFYHRVRNQYDPVPFSAYIDTLIDNGNSLENMAITFLNAGATLVKNLLNYHLDSYPYKHIGYMRVFGSDERDITDSYEDMTIFDSGKLLLNIKEHFMDAYISRLERYADPEVGLDDYKYSWNGNGSIVTYSAGNKKGNGIEKDLSKVHRDSDKYPVVFFQWQRHTNYGGNLKISADSDYKSATIHYGAWNSPIGDRKTFKNVKLPFVLDPTKDGFSSDNGKWFIIAVIFNKAPKFSSKIRATATYDKGTNNTPDKYIGRVYFDNRYWSGNGSLISYSSGDKIGVGVTKDYAVVNTELNGKPSIFFQWEVDSSDGKNVKIESVISRCIDKVRITTGEWSPRDYDSSFDVTLPYTLKTTKRDGDWVLFRIDVLSKPICSQFVLLKVSIEK